MKGIFKMNLEQRVKSEIKRLRETKITYREISEKTGISKVTAWRALNEISGTKAETLFLLEKNGLINLLYGYKYD